MQIKHGGWRIAEPGESYHLGEPIVHDAILIQSLKGRVRYGCDGREVELRPLQLLVLPPRLPNHSWRVVGQDPWEVRWLGLGLRRNEHQRLQYPAHVSGLIPLPFSQTLAGIIDGPLRRIFQLWGRQEPEAVALRDQFADSLVREINLFHGLPQQPQDPHVARALDHIDRHLIDPDLALGDIVAASGCGRSALARRFTAAMGSPPMRYLEERRLDVAAERLRRDDDTIAAIARAIGFSEARYFATRFRRRFGCTPTAYRSA